MGNRTLSLVVGFISALTFQLSAQSSSDIKWMVLNDSIAMSNPKFSTEGTYIQCFSDRSYDNRTLTRYFYIYEAETGRSVYHYQSNVTPVYFLTDTTMLVYSYINDGEGKSGLLLQEMQIDGTIIRTIDTIPVILQIFDINSGIILYATENITYPPISVRNIFTGETITHPYSKFFDASPQPQTISLIDQGKRVYYIYQAPGGGFRFRLRNTVSAKSEFDASISPTPSKIVRASLNENFAVLLGQDFFVRVAHFESGSVTRQINSSKLYSPLLNTIVDAELSPNGTYLAVPVYDGTICLWNLWTGKEVHVFNEYIAQTAIEFSPDGKHLLSTTADGALIMWKMPEGTTGVEEEEKYGTHSSELTSSAIHNPATERVSVRFALPERSDVHIDFYTLRGQHIGQIDGGRMEGGENRLEWDGAVLPTGAYFYRINAGSSTEVGRFLVQF